MFRDKTTNFDNITVLNQTHYFFKVQYENLVHQTTKFIVYCKSFVQGSMLNPPANSAIRNHILRIFVALFVEKRSKCCYNEKVQTMAITQQLQVDLNTITQQLQVDLNNFIHE